MDEMVRQNGAGAKDTDEYVALQSELARKLSDSQRISNQYEQSKNFIQKYGIRANVLGKMDRKLIRESLTIEGERANQDKQKQKGFKVSKMLSKSVQKVKKPRSKEGRSALRSAVHKQKQNK